MSTPDHALHLGVVIFILLFVVILLIYMCHGIHRFKNHRKLADIYKSKAQAIINNPNRTDEDVQKLIKYHQYLKNDSWASLSNMIYEPIADSKLGYISDALLFHTTIGRTSLAAQVQLNTFIQSSMATLLGFRMNSYLTYIISISDVESNAQVTVLALVVAFTILVIVATSQLNFYIQSQLSNNNIIAEDETDRILASGKVEE